MKGDDLSERLLDFSIRIIKLSEALPKTAIGKHIYLQIIRSSTSAGANYEEARAAESKADFAHKISLTLKELRETFYWLRIITKIPLIPPERLKEIMNETDQLCRIMGKSILTARNK
ncbi:MAG: four helix bundle protein [Sedimentisphaerales bacterium]|nr:four helix bundle protein [Sedimentisphaerales bacterium]